MHANTEKPVKKNLNTKKAKRKLRKRQKLGALVQISTLNDQDRQKRSLGNSSTGPKGNVNKGNAAEGPERKRLRKDVKYLLNGQENCIEVPQVFGDLTDEQKKLLKRLLEERSKKRQARPTLELNEVAEAADLKKPKEERVPLTIDDFQHFIIYSLLGNMSTKGFSRWAQLMKSEKVKHRIFVVIEGAGLKEYLENEASLATLREFESRLEIVTPLTYRGNLIEELAMVPMTNTQRFKLAEEYGSLKKAMEVGEIHKALRTVFRIKEKPNFIIPGVPKPQNVHKGPDKFSRKLLLLSPWDMIEENYPVPVSGELGSKYKNYLFTRDEYEEVTDNSPMWSLDCEMCITSNGSELTRICIVNEAHQVVYETLVKPYNPILNYVTEYSGITAKMLRNVTTRLEDVQKHIRSICPPDLILIGQSLNGDLTALKMMHPYVIDTSVIFNISGVKHRKTKLRVLTEEFLSERIQLGLDGHSPIEDALAAMKLVQTKLQHSIGWGNAILSGPRPEEESQAARALLEQREAAGGARLKVPTVDHTFNYELSTSLMSHLVRHEKNVLLVGKKIVIEKWSHYFKASNAIEVAPTPTQKAAVKVARNKSPVGGTTILHMSLSSRTPSNAIAKADRLVEKLLRKPMPNTLYTVLLAGRQDSPGNGLMFIHLLREHIPLVKLPDKT